GLLTNLLSHFRRDSRRARPATGRKEHRRQTSIEQLEDRRLLVTRVWLDFGDGYAAAAQGTPYAGLGTLLGLNFDPIHDALVRAPTAGNQVAYEEELGLMLNNATAGPNPFNFVGLNSYVNSNLSPVIPMDALTLEMAITAQIQRALEPYDIQIISSFNSNIVN